MTKNINKVDLSTDNLYLSSLDIMDGQLTDYNDYMQTSTTGGKVRRRRQADSKESNENRNGLYFKPESKTVRYLFASGLVAYGAGIFYLMLRDQNHSKDIIFKT